MKITVWKNKVKKECKEKRKLARLKARLSECAPAKKEARNENA